MSECKCCQDRPAAVPSEYCSVCRAEIAALYRPRAHELQHECMMEIKANMIYWSSIEQRRRINEEIDLFLEGIGVAVYVTVEDAFDTLKEVFGYKPWTLEGYHGRHTATA